MNCKWKEDIDGLWWTGCGGLFEVIGYTPKENGMDFCCYCGRTLDQIEYEEGEND